LVGKAKEERLLKYLDVDGREILNLLLILCRMDRTSWGHRPAVDSYGNSLGSIKLN